MNTNKKKVAVYLWQHAAVHGLDDPEDPPGFAKANTVWWRPRGVRQVVFHDEHWRRH
jgi:hypothetical protein